MALAGFKQQAVSAIRAAAIKKGLTPGMATLVLNGDFFSAVLGTLDAHTYGGTEAIRQARLPNLYGFQEIVEWPDLGIPGFVCNPDAIAVANRYLAPVDPRGYEEVGTMTDDQTGLTLGLRRFMTRNAGKLNTSVELFYGRDVGQADGLMRIV